MKKRINELIFHEIDEAGKVQISHSKLIRFLEIKGFRNIKLSETNYLLVRIQDNKVKESSIGEVIQVIRMHLNKENLFNVYEAFVKGIGSYLSAMKIKLLELRNLIDDRDETHQSRFYFQNKFVEITHDGYRAYDYDKLEGVIWENRLIEHDFNTPKCKKFGQYESFCWKLCKKDDLRFEGFKSMLGYLLHRNRDKGEDKAVILYDENMGQNNLAHGGTGKSIQIQALRQCREVEVFDGKEIKSGSWFKNQRINLTSDILFYDDLNRNVSLESFFPMITSGIEVEKKGKQAFYISRESAPKIVLTSNYFVKGPGGPSDKRRRYEFELANYYSDRFTPEMDFGNRFFSKEWSAEEWNKFFRFMIECLQVYLKDGLIYVPKINIQKAKLLNECCQEFIEYLDILLEMNSKIDKRKFHLEFEEFYPEVEKVTSHRFTKWLKAYAESNDAIYKDWSSGGNYFFNIKTK